MQKTEIGWTDFSANLLKYRDADSKTVWHCEKISPGCTNCYAAELARRYGRGGPFNASQTAKVVPFFDEDEARKILRSKKLAGKRVFIDDMTDLFGDWVPDEIIDRHFAVFALRPDATFQVLTKRAERMRRYFDGHPQQRIADAMDRDYTNRPWPLPNVHLGVSAENQWHLNERYRQLVKTPATVRWISVEPLLGPLELFRCPDYHGIDWVVVGGESGRNHRPCEVEWIQAIADHCRAAGIPCFIKQDAALRPGQRGRLPLDLWELKQLPEPVTT